MAVFTITDEWDSTEPLGSRNAGDIDAYIRNLKAALIERYELEHYSIEEGAAGTSTTKEASTAQGRHIAGLVGCIGRGTHTAMNAMSNPGEGAFWITTDASGAPDNYPEGTTYRYTSGAWVTSQLASGTIYASAVEAIDETTDNKALSPVVVPDIMQSTLNPFINYAKFHHTETAGTDGGTFTSGAWQIRQLTQVTNNITGVSVATNKVTLPAGTYKVQAKAIGQECGAHMIAIWNDTDSSFELTGMSADNSNNTSTTATLSGQFTIAAGKDIELQHRCSATKNTNGLGKACNFGVAEVYAELEIWRLD